MVTCGPACPSARISFRWLGRSLLSLLTQTSLLSVLKAEQTSLLKFPMSPLTCSLGSPLGPPLQGLQVGAASHHLPLDLHLRGKLEHGVDGGGKTKKGRRSRTVFTELQLMGLEKRFEKQKYLSTPDRCVRGSSAAAEQNNSVDSVRRVVSLLNAASAFGLFS